MQAVVQCVIEHRLPPEQILNAIIEEIKSNEGQIKKEGKVNVELIESVVSGFIIAVDEEQFELSMGVEDDCEPEHGEELESSKGNQNNNQRPDSLSKDKINKQNVSPSNPKKNVDILHSTKGNKLSIITASVGLLLGLSIAYLAGTAALTIVSAVTVFVIAAVVGTLVGYGVGKFCQRVSEEKQEDPDLSTWDAVKSVFSDVFTTGHSEPKLQA